MSRIYDEDIKKGIANVKKNQWTAVIQNHSDREIKVKMAFRSAQGNLTQDDALCEPGGYLHRLNQLDWRTVQTINVGIHTGRVSYPPFDLQVLFDRIDTLYRPSDTQSRLCNLNSLVMTPCSTHIFYHVAKWFSLSFCGFSNQ